MLCKLTEFHTSFWLISNTLLYYFYESQSISTYKSSLSIISNCCRTKHFLLRQFSNFFSSHELSCFSRSLMSSFRRLTVLESLRAAVAWSIVSGTDSQTHRLIWVFRPWTEYLNRHIYCNQLNYWAAKFYYYEINPSSISGYSGMSPVNTAPLNSFSQKRRTANGSS